MPENFFGKRQTESHKEYRPVNGVESYYVLADDVNVARPALVEEFGRIAVRVVTDAGDVISQRVEPDVNDVRRIEIDGNTPFERRSRNAEILQSRKKKIVHHFVLSRNGIDEIGVGIDIIYKFGSVFAHFEEIRFLFGFFHFAAAIGAFAACELAFRPERLARGAIPAFVRALINIALIVKLFEDFADLFFVIFIGRSDKVVVIDVHALPHRFDLVRNHIDVFFGRFAEFAGFFFDFLPVFVRSRLQINVVTLFFSESRYAVGKNRLVSVAYMWLGRSVSDCRRYIIFLFHMSDLPSLICLIYFYYNILLRKSKT